MKKSSLTKLIKKSAKLLSFSHVGIAKARKYKEDHDRLNNWVDNGYLLPDILKPEINEEEWISALIKIINREKIDIVLKLYRQ